MIGDPEDHNAEPNGTNEERDRGADNLDGREESSDHAVSQFIIERNERAELLRKIDSLTKENKALKS